MPSANAMSNSIPDRDRYRPDLESSLREEMIVREQV
jgi:hypothetical protein